MKHVLGVMGVLAASVLLVVSAAMNWRFGYSLGKTELDGQIYGAASAAADCLKALAPFFFFAAIRNRMWAQAVASAAVLVVVTGYSLTSALGHAALNRLDTTGQRAVAAEAYQDLRADLKRARDQLSWVPKHRPAETVRSDIESARSQRAWTYTNGCTEIASRQGRIFCQNYHALNAELASATQAAALEARIGEIEARLGKTDGVAAMAEADPQAAVLSKLTGIDVASIQILMTVFIALLLEIGSGFGMFIAFSQWKLYEREPVRPRVNRDAADAAPQFPAAGGTLDAEAAETMDGPGEAEKIAAPSRSRSEPVALLGFENTVSGPSGEVREDAQVHALPAAGEEAQETGPEPEGASADEAAEAQPVSAASAIANDNVLALPKPLKVPKSDVERFYYEGVEPRQESSVSAAKIYEGYVRWCMNLGKTPLRQARFAQEFLALGVMKRKNGRGTVYDGIALKGDLDLEPDKNEGVSEGTKVAAFRVA